MIEWFSSISNASAFMPHGQCLFLQRAILLLHRAGHTGISLAYLSIPLAFIGFVKKRRNLALKSAYVLFAAFISSLAATHVMDAITLWNPVYDVDALLRIVTASVSLYTAIMLYPHPLIPKAPKLPSSALLEEKNRELLAEIEECKKVENELHHIKDDLEKIVESRTRELRESEEKFLLLVDGIECYGLFLLDNNGSFISWNSGAQRITGYAQEEVIGKNFAIIFTEDDRRKGVPKLELERAAHRGAASDERWHTKKDGSIFWASGTTHALKDEFGKIRGFAKVMADETAKHKAEVSLKESEAKFRAISESLPQLVWSALPDGSIDYFNARWLEYTGSRIEDNLGSGWMKFVHPDDQDWVHEKWTSSVKTEGVYEAEVRIRRHDGIYEWHLVRGYPVSGENGRVIKWLGTSTNIEPQKQAEQSLQKAKQEAEQASQAKSQFLANMSHEIRTPLGAMLGFVKLLKDPELTTPERDGFIDVIIRNGETLISLIEDILDLSKVESGHLNVEREPIELSTLITEIINLFSQRAKEKAITLEVAAEGLVPEKIETDVLRLRQILINIVGNAIKFTDKGTVTIKVKLNMTENKKQMLEFLVEDNGIGIRKEYQDQLFQFFSQADNKPNRKFGGTGLGLALSRKLAELLGGGVYLVRSAEGEGSIFSIQIDPGDVGKLTETLNLCQRKAPISESGAKPDKRLQGRSILIAEDAPDNQALLSYLLTMQGAKVEIAENGEEALHKVSMNSFDIILMDIQMPVMDGVAAVQCLRKDHYSKPIIALTAHAFREEKLRCITAGFNDYISKPINEGRLIDLLSSYLQS